MNLLLQIQITSVYFGRFPFLGFFVGFFLQKGGIDWKKKKGEKKEKNASWDGLLPFCADKRSLTKALANS